MPTWRLVAPSFRRETIDDGGGDGGVDGCDELNEMGTRAAANYGAREKGTSQWKVQCLLCLLRIKPDTRSILCFSFVPFCKAFYMGFSDL